MNNAPETNATHLVIRPGLIQRAQERAGIVDDSAFARLLNMDTAEVERLKNGGEVSIRGLVGIAQAFGTPLRDIVADPQPTAVAA